MEFLSSLIESSKYLEAETYYNNNINNNEITFTDQQNELIQLMLNRAKLSIDTIDNIEHSKETDWIHGMRYFGVTTYYQVDKQNRLHVKLEGVLDNVPLFNQAAVIYEVDLFKSWIPFCSNSKLIDRITDTDVVSYISSYIPPIGRDCLIRVYASDCLTEHDKIVLIGSPLNEWTAEDKATHTLKPSTSSSTTITTTTATATTTSIDTTSSTIAFCAADAQSITNTTTGVNQNMKSTGIKEKEVLPVPVPWIQKGWFNDRMEVIDFRAVLTVLSPTSIQVQWRSVSASMCTISVYIC